MDKIQKTAFLQIVTHHRQNTLDFSFTIIFQHVPNLVKIGQQ
jgi:hypothetical protein